MIVTLDRLSSRYSKLPSQVINEASTFDLQVMDIGIRYETVAKQKRDGTYVKPLPKLSEQEMLAILKRAKNGKSGQNKIQPKN